MYQSARRAMCDYCGRLILMEQLSRIRWESNFEELWIDEGDVVCTSCSKDIPAFILDKGTRFYLYFRAY